MVLLALMRPSEVPGRPGGHPDASAAVRHCSISAHHARRTAHISSLRDQPMILCHGSSPTTWRVPGGGLAGFGTRLREATGARGGGGPVAPRRLGERALLLFPPGRRISPTRCGGGFDGYLGA